MADVPRSIVVAAAVIEREGRFLVTLRHPDAHLGRHWEFPGGKCHAGESPAACLAREIREELDADIMIGEELLTTHYRYPDRIVQLKFFQGVLLNEPRGALGQQMRWVTREELAALQFPPADKELIALLIGPDDRRG